MLRWAEILLGMALRFKPDVGYRVSHGRIARVSGGTPFRAQTQRVRDE
jgi:hypothetical protein